MAMPAADEQLASIRASSRTYFVVSTTAEAVQQSFKSLWFWFLQVTTVAYVSAIISQHFDSSLYGVIASLICFVGIFLLVLSMHFARSLYGVLRYIPARNAIYHLVSQYEQQTSSSTRFLEARRKIREAAVEPELRTQGQIKGRGFFRKIRPIDWHTSELDEEDLLNNKGSPGRIIRRFTGIPFSAYENVRINRLDFFKLWPKK